MSWGSFLCSLSLLSCLCSRFYARLLSLFTSFFLSFFLSCFLSLLLSLFLAFCHSLSLFVSLCLSLSLSFSLSLSLCHSLSLSVPASRHDMNPGWDAEVKFRTRCMLRAVSLPLPPTKCSPCCHCVVTVLSPWCHRVVTVLWLSICWGTVGLGDIAPWQIRHDDVFQGAASHRKRLSVLLAFSIPVNSARVRLYGSLRPCWTAPPCSAAGLWTLV